MNLSVWRHETRRCGPATLSLPVVVAAAIALASAAAAGSTGDPRVVGPGMVRLVADVFPVAVGLAAVSALSRERAAELQLTLPTPYPVTVARRLALLLVVSTAAAAAAVAVLGAAGQWEHPARGPLTLLVPLGPAVLLTGTAVLAAAVTPSGGGASAVVIAVWLVQVLMVDRIVGTWQINRLFLAGVGLLAWWAAGRLLGEGERTLRGGAE